MFRLVSALVISIGLSLGFCEAQSVNNLYLVGGSYTPGAVPAFAGSGLYAHQVNTSGTYAFTMLDAVPNTLKPFTVTSNFGVGIAQKVGEIDGVGIFVPTSAGISYTGTNTGWAWTTGVGLPIALKNKAKGWYVMPSLRVLKSSVSNGTGYQPIFGLMVGWGQ